MIQIRINGRTVEVAEGTTIRAMLLERGFVPDAVAVAVDGEVVPRAKHAERALRAGEAVEVIRAVGGG